MPCWFGANAVALGVDANMKDDIIMTKQQSAGHQCTYQTTIEHANLPEYSTDEKHASLHLIWTITSVGPSHCSQCIPDIQDVLVFDGL